MNRSLKRAGRVAIVLIGSIVAITPATEAEPEATDPQLQSEVRRLIDELGAPVRATRSTAEKRLLEIGPAALPHFPPPDLLPSVSVRATVERIRHELERRHALDSMRPSAVTLADNLSLGSALREISRQSRNRLDESPLSVLILDRQLSPGLDESAFWPALDRVLTQAQLMFEPDPTRRGLRIVPRGPESRRISEAVAYAGPFRLSASPAELIPIGEPQPDQPQKRLLRVLLYAQPEPRLRPLFLQFTSAENVAEVESKPLPPFNPEASYELVVNEPGGRSRMQLDFVLPAGEDPKHVDLRGTFRMTTAADTAAIRFADVTRSTDGKPLGIDRRRGGVTVTLQRVRRERGSDGKTELRIRVTVAYDSGGPAFESHRTWILHNEVFLEAADGTRLPLNGGYETTLQQDGAVGMEYRFVDLPEVLPELAFVYLAPTLIVDVPVRYALESLPVRRRE